MTPCDTDFESAFFFPFLSFFWPLFCIRASIYPSSFDMADIIDSNAERIHCELQKSPFLNVVLFTQRYICKL